MDTLLSFVNAGAFGLICLALLGAILSPRVHDGVVIKMGLICMAMGFGAVALQLWQGIDEYSLLGLERALLLVNAGIAVVIVGYLWRKAKVCHPVRRSTDWADLVETSPMETDR